MLQNTVVRREALAFTIKEELILATQSCVDNSVLRQGMVFGTILGVMLLVFNLINSVANLDATRETWLKNGLVIAMFVLPGLVGFIGSKETGQVKTGALTVLVTGLVSAVVGIITVWVIALLFMDVIRHNTLMILGFQRSGMASIDTFIGENALGRSIFLFVFSVAFGAGYGVLGSLLGARYARLPVQL